MARTLAAGSLVAKITCWPECAPRRLREDRLVRRPLRLRDTSLDQRGSHIVVTLQPAYHRNQLRSLKEDQLAVAEVVHQSAERFGPQRH